MHPYLKRFIAPVFAAAMLAETPCAIAQNFPDKPIRLVVPWAPGGTGDLLARALVEGLAPVFKPPVIVDNRPGAGGTIGAASVARAPGDGYTLLIGDIGPMAIAPSAYKTLPYDPIRDFAPVTIGTLNSLSLAVHPSLPVNSVREFIALARSRPGEISYGSSGVGGVLHLAGELFKTMAGVDLLHVPYKGGSAAIAALVAGEVAVSFSALPTTMPFAQGNRVKILAITMDKRAQLAPALPTINEAGVRGYSVTVWQGVLAPATTPREIVMKLNAAMTEALKKPEISNRLRTQGFEVVTGTPEDFAKYIRDEVGKWEKVVRGAHIVLD